jgi:hypothetical protein
MRKDMSKVIVERPRRGRSAAGLRAGRTRVVTDDDGEPVRTSKGTAREPKGPARKTKNLNENLNPLKRYLASNVGRPWNKVFSEISEHLKPTSTVQQHVRDHIDDFVATKTRMQNGVVMIGNARRGGESTLEHSYVLYYVHPRTGLLRKNQHRISRTALARQIREAKQAERDTRMREIDAKTQVHLFNGDWWEVKLAKIGRQRLVDSHGRISYIVQAYTDVVHAAKLSKLSITDLYGRDGVYACEKRQLSKAEIKRLRLR